MNATMEETVNREFLRYHVGREMFCPITGKILDVRTAVSITTKDGEGNTQAMICVDGSVWDRQEREVVETISRNGGAVEVIDGRTL